MATIQLKKRIVMCCDGTWMDSDGDVQFSSNITKLARSIKPIGVDNSTNPPQPITQVVFYQNGVGTGSKSVYTKYVGGATGEGISFNIREAYSFICHNYHDGDEIFLIGFSRGAFTARSVSSLIRAIGLLTPKGLKYLTPIFEDWKFASKKDYKSKYNKPWPNRPRLYTKEYQRKLLELELTRPDINIKCVAVWDTVGALGIPKIAILPQGPSTDYAFVDARTDNNVEYAYQALALDEHRRTYKPTLWEKPANQAFPRVLKQCWFPGVHSDVGGSYEDADLANITLAWMVSQLENILTMDHEIIMREIRLARESHEARGERVRLWGLGKIHNSMSLFFRLLGSQIRTPREYYEIDRLTRKDTGRRLENTGETVHSSVRIRMGRDGLGYNDKGRYDSSALQGWTMHGVETDPQTPIALSLPGAVGKMKEVVWKKTVRIQARRGKGKVIEETLEMPEDQLQGFERRLLNLWPELVRDFDSLKPGRHPTEILKAATFPGQKKHAPVLAAAIPERMRSVSRRRESESGSERSDSKDSFARRIKSHGSQSRPDELSRSRSRGRPSVTNGLSMTSSKRDELSPSPSRQQEVNGGASKRVSYADMESIERSQSIGGALTLRNNSGEPTTTTRPKSRIETF